MSALNLTDPSQISPGVGGTRFVLSGLSNVIQTTFEETWRNFNPISEDLAMSDEIRNRQNLYNAITGGNLYVDVLNSIPENERFKMQTEIGRRYKGSVPLRDELTPEFFERVDEYITRLQKKDVYKGVLTRSQINRAVVDKANEALKEAQQAREGATGFNAFAGSIIGGFGAQIYDPVTVLSTFLGAGAASSVIKVMFIEAAINSTSEVVSHPFIAKWQKELGNTYGVSELIQNAALSGLFGAVIGGGIKGLGKFASKAEAMTAIANKIEEGGEIPITKGLVGPDADLQNNQLISALRAESRRFQLIEGKPDNVSMELHRTVLEKTEEALRKGEVFDVSSIGISDDDFLNAKMPAATREAHKVVIDKSALDPKFDPNRLRELNKKPSVGDNFATIHDTNLERITELADLNETPEARIRIDSNFTKLVEEKKFKKDELIIEDDELGIDRGKKDMTFGELQDFFKENDQAVKALEICSKLL